jgi:hypothetical protein
MGHKIIIIFLRLPSPDDLVDNSEKTIITKANPKVKNLFFENRW